MDPSARKSLEDLAQRQIALTEHLAKIQREHSAVELAIEELRKEVMAGAEDSLEEKSSFEGVELETDVLADIDVDDGFVVPPKVPPMGDDELPVAEVEEDAETAGLSAELASSEEDSDPVPDMIEKPNWEVNLGQTWLVRIGVLSLLTGLIFLSTYAYKNWVYDAAPSLKVGLFMLFSLGLAGGGLYFERAKENLRQYGRAITAGGLAAAYYTIYAAHFVESLYCISSPVLAGALLTAWAALMLVYACWKQSKLISIMATGLAFYGTIVNPAGWISLFSALLLSASGMFLLVRYKWNNVGIITVCSAYVAHAFWLGYYPQELVPAVRYTYLTSYWLIFACATSRFAGASIEVNIARVISSINNSAAWVLAVFLIPSFVNRPELGRLSLCFGALLLLCSSLAFFGKVWRKELFTVYLFQGLFLVTVGIMVEASGYHRFLILVLEAVLLLLASNRLKNLWLNVASLLVYVASIVSLVSASEPPLLSYLAFAVVSAIYAGLLRRYLLCGKSNESLIAIFPAVVSWLVVYSGVFADFATIDALSYTTVVAAVLWAVFLAWRKPMVLVDLAMVATVVPLLCGFALVINFSDSANPLSWGLPAIGVGMWWTSTQLEGLKRKYWSDDSDENDWLDISELFGWAYGVFVSFAVWQLFSLPEHDGFMWLCFAGPVAIGAYFISTLEKRMSLAVPAQLLYFGSLFYIERNSEVISLLPLIYLIIHIALSEWLWGAKPVLRRYLAPVAALACVCLFKDSEVPVSLLALAFYGLAYHRKDNVFTVCGVMLPLFISIIVGAADVYRSYDALVYLPMTCLLIVCALPSLGDNPLKGMWRFAKYSMQYLAMLIVFAYASFHTLDSHDGSGLAICWALLAAVIFTLGLLTKYRSYRLTGLLWLAAAIVHVVTVDVMALNTLGRIFSFMTIGVILMGLGYLYNRFQDRIAKFL